MQLFIIKTNLGYYSGQLPEQYPIFLGRCYQNSGIDKINWSDRKNASEVSKRSLAGIINSIACVLSDNLENIEYINIEINENK